MRLEPEARRLALIEATLRSLALRGVKETGLRQVCRDLGVAPGLVTHFFGGWRGLLVESYRHLQARFQARFDAVLAGPGTDRERLEALLDWFFDPAWFDDVFAGAHVALWALSRTETDLREIMTEFYGRQRDGLAGVLGGEDAQDRAEALLVFLNGLWMEMILNPGNVSPERGRRLAGGWVGVEFQSILCSKFQID